MKRLIWDQPERVARFVADKAGCKDGYPEATAIGLERDGVLIGGVAYCRFTGANVDAHIGSDGSHGWMTPAFLAAIFRYPFLQLGVRRITAPTRADNPAARRINEHFGFIAEGVIREGSADGTDVIIYGMLARECRFLEGRPHAALLRAA